MIDKIRKTIAYYSKSYVIHCNFLYLLILTYANLLPVLYSMFTNAQSRERGGVSMIRPDKT